MTIQQHASFDSSAAELNATSKLVKAWESKNAKNAAKAGGVSLMALSLAACGGSDSTTTAVVADPVTPVTPVTPVAAAPFELTPLVDIASGTQALNGSLANAFRFTDGNDTVTALTATIDATDTLLDVSGTDADVMNITVTGDMALMNAVNIETVNVNFASGSAAAARFTNFSGTDAINVTGSVAATVEDAGAATIATSDYTRTLTVDVDSLAGSTAAGNADSMNLSVSGATFGTTAATQTTLALTVQGTTDATDGVLETLNITSTGSAANTFALSTDADMTLSTINLSGDTAATVRVAEADVTGNTIVASGSGAKRINLDADSNGATPVNAANWSGLDAIEIRDSATGSATDAVRINSAADGTQLVVKNSVGTTELSVVGSSRTVQKDAVTLELNGSSTTAGVTVSQFGSSTLGQNIATLNVESLGLASSTSTTAANTISTLIGDYTTVTLSGDTSLAISSVDIDPTEGASSTSARAVTIDASSMTGNAFVSLTAAADAKVSYTMTGTAGADTLVANNSGSSLTGLAGADTLTGGSGVDTILGGAGADHIDMSTGADTLTGGAGNDTFDLNDTLTAAVKQINEIKIFDGASTGGTGNHTADNVWAAGDTITITINDVAMVYEVTASDVALVEDVAGTAAEADDDADVITDSLIAAINTTFAGTVVASTDTEGHIINITAATAGTGFTLAVADSDATAVVQTAATSTVNVVAADVASTITDFASGDILDTVGLGSLGTGGYYEGDAGTLTAGTAYGVIVITDTAHASWEAAEDDVAARSTSTSEGIVIFLNSTTGVAEAHYESDLGADDTTASTDILVTFDNISNLTDLAAVFSSDSFVI